MSDIHSRVCEHQWRVHLQREVKIRVAVADRCSRLPGIPELLVRYDVAFTASRSPCPILQHAVHPAKPGQVDLDYSTGRSLHVREHSDPCHGQE